MSTVATNDLSDQTDSDEEEETWNDNENSVEVATFTAATGPTSDVAEDATVIDFFYLMFPRELIEHIILETNCYARASIATKPDPE